MRRDKEKLEAELAEMRGRWRGKKPHPGRRIYLARTRKTASTRKKREQVASMYRDGASTFDIAAALDMTPETVRKHLHKAGVPLRSYSEAVKLAWGKRGNFLSRKRAPAESKLITGKQPGCEWQWCGTNKLCSDCAEVAHAAPASS